jgi:hypothetical protein
MNLRAREAVSTTEEKVLEAEWRERRRGWYHGGDSFRDELLYRMEGVLKRKRRRSFDGAAMHGHDEPAARRLLADALLELGVERKTVRAMKKNEPLKQSLVWLLKTRTTMSNDWIDEQLSLGDRRNITRAVAAGRNRRSREMRSLRKRLEMIMSQCPD